MGRPKPFLSIGRRELLQIALDAASDTCSSIVLVGAEAGRLGAALRRYGWKPGDPAEKAAFVRGSARLRLCTDLRPGQGPLAGLETAWQRGWATDALTGEVWPPPRWWVLGTDLPFITGAVGRRLLEELQEWHEGAPAAGDRQSARAVVPLLEGQAQPLCAAYEAGAASLATRCLDEGRRAMSQFVECLEVRHLMLEPPLAAQLENVNTPADLARARLRARP